MILGYFHFRKPPAQKAHWNIPKKIFPWSQWSHLPTMFRQLAFPTSYILIIFSLAGWKGLVQKGPGTRNSWGWLQSHPMVYKKGVGLWHWLYYICITYRWNPKYATVESSWVTRSHCGSSWRCFPFWNLHFDHFGGIQYTVYTPFPNTAMKKAEECWKKCTVRLPQSEFVAPEINILMGKLMVNHDRTMINHDKPW